MSDIFKIGERTFHSRLIVGTGKYKDLQETADAVKASGADIVTVAVRRVNITDTKEPLLMDFIDPKKITYLPNTAGCFNSEDALRTLRLAKESGGTQSSACRRLVRTTCLQTESTCSLQRKMYAGS